jgi:hypothetical protein
LELFIMPFSEYFPFDFDDIDFFPFDDSDDIDFFPFDFDDIDESGGVASTRRLKKETTRRAIILEVFIVDCYLNEKVRKE